MVHAWIKIHSMFEHEAKEETLLTDEWSKYITLYIIYQTYGISITHTIIILGCVKSREV